MALHRWATVVIKVLETVIHATEVYDNCYPVYTMIMSRNIHWFELGKQIGACAKKIRILRRRKDAAALALAAGSNAAAAAADVPAAWTCDSAWYAPPTGAFLAAAPRATVLLVRAKRSCQAR